jgi:hypothetical protein
MPEWWKKPDEPAQRDEKRSLKKFAERLLKGMTATHLSIMYM